MTKPRKTFTPITSTVAARRFGSLAGGDIYRYDLTHPDGTTDTDLGRKKAVEILSDRYPKSNFDALTDLLRAAEEAAYKANPDPLAEAPADALHNQLTNGRSWLPKQDPPPDPPAPIPAACGATAPDLERAGDAGAVYSIQCGREKGHHGHHQRSAPDGRWTVQWARRPGSET